MINATNNIHELFPNAQIAPSRLISQKEVLKRVGLSRSTVYLQIKAGNFPPSVKISPSRIGWLESDIDQFIADKVRASRT